jgi:tetratricopeptide (TPR) repeat protein
VLRLYVTGEREKAVSELAGWPEEQVREQVRILGLLGREARACRVCEAARVLRRTPLKAALMLHSDCAERVRRDGQASRLHESAAVEIARLLKDEPAGRSFARRWYEAMAGLAQGENRWNEALEWAERGLRDFPVSAEMLLVLGSIEETVGAQAPFLDTSEALFDPDPSRSERHQRHEVREHLEKARRALRSAVAADPALLEARLRLGRVAWRLGETAEARSALEEVLSRSKDASTAFLAHLFLGRIDEDAGRLEDAARSYGAALALVATAQSARLALSHVRLRSGDTPGARAEVEKSIGAAGRRPQPDPLWLYPWGPTVGLEDRLDALRRESES